MNYSIINLDTLLRWLNKDSFYLLDFTFKKITVNIYEKM